MFLKFFAVAKSSSTLLVLATLEALVLKGSWLCAIVVQARLPGTDLINIPSVASAGRAAQVLATRNFVEKFPSLDGP